MAANPEMHFRSFTFDVLAKGIIRFINDLNVSSKRPFPSLTFKDKKFRFLTFPIQRLENVQN